VHFPQALGLSMTEPSLRYRLPAQILHWVTALAIFCGVSLGVAMLKVAQGPLQNQLFDQHRSFGALILGLTGIRLLWRLYSAPPPITAPMQARQGRAVQATHAALYLLLFAVPLVGWAGVSAFGASISVFNVFMLPMILEQNKPLADVLLRLHTALAFTLCALLVMHIGAALHHHFIRKDDTLCRMLPKL
jgi:cytochrome b561